MKPQAWIRSLLLAVSASLLSLVLAREPAPAPAPAKTDFAAPALPQALYAAPTVLPKRDPQFFPITTDPRTRTTTITISSTTSSLVDVSRTCRTLDRISTLCFTVGVVTSIAGIGCPIGAADAVIGIVGVISNAYNVYTSQSTENIIAEVATLAAIIGSAIAFGIVGTEAVAGYAAYCTTLTVLGVLQNGFCGIGIPLYQARLGCNSLRARELDTTPLELFPRQIGGNPCTELLATLPPGVCELLPRLTSIRDACNTVLSDPISLSTLEVSPSPAVNFCNTVQGFDEATLTMLGKICQYRAAVQIFEPYCNVQGTPSQRARVRRNSVRLEREERNREPW